MKPKKTTQLLDAVYRPPGGGITKSLPTATPEAMAPPDDIASGLALIQGLRGSLKGETSVVEYREREHRLEDEARTKKLSRHFRGE